MSRKRFAIITFDPDVIEATSVQAGGEDVAFALFGALKGRNIAGVRGIINVTLMDRVEIEPGPVDRWLANHTPPR